MATKFNAVDNKDIFHNKISRQIKHLALPTIIGMIGGLIVCIAYAYLMDLGLVKLLWNTLKAFASSEDVMLTAFGKEVLTDDSVNFILKVAEKMILLFFVSSIAFSIASYVMISRLATKISGGDLEDQFVKGSKIMDEEYTIKNIPELADATKGSVVGHKGLIFPFENHPSHMFFVGSPGAGKTVLMARMYMDIRRKNSAANFIIHDGKGDYIKKFYNPETDYIFNFSDKRSINYTVFSIMKTTNDLKSIVATIIPRGVDEKEPIWTDSARGILEGIFLYCIKNNKKTNLYVKRLILTPAGKLVKLLKDVKGAESAVAFLTGSDTQVANFMSNLNSKCSFFTSLPKSAGYELDIEKWLEGKGSTIFLLNDIKNQDLNAVRISVFVDSIVKAQLTMSESKTRKTYFILDEFGSLNKMSSIISGLTLGRSFGLCMFIGIQDNARINSIYGKDLASTMINSISTKIILRAGDPETQLFASKIIGQIKFQTTAMSNSTGAEGGAAREGSSFSQSEKIEDLVLPAEVGLLKNNCYYYKTTGHDWIYVETDYIPKIDYVEDTGVVAFDQRDDLSIDNLFSDEIKEEDEDESEEEVSGNSGQEKEDDLDPVNDEEKSMGTW